MKNRKYHFHFSVTDVSSGQIIGTLDDRTRPIYTMLMAMHFNQLTLTAFRTRIVLISFTMISRNKVTHPVDFYMKKCLHVPEPVVFQLVRFRTTALNGQGFS